MFKKMVKLKNKKAFTLIEMMAVVAIVAILVAILVPVIGNSTVKSRAATNAANLRAVEAELATLKVSNPECFVPKSTTSPGAELSYVLKFLYGENAAVKYLDSVTAQNGTLTFTEKLVGNGASVSLDGVPTSVAVKADVGMDVADDAQMIIQLIDNEIVAVYPSADGKVYFDKNCFAEVAETGKFTGTGTDSSDGGVRGWLNETFCPEGILHSWEVQGTKHVCKNCGASYTHTDEKASDLDIFGVFGRDGKCDHCTATCGTAGSGIAHVWDNGVCKQCGKVYKDEYPDHVCTSWDSNHKCTCGEKHGASTWVWKNDKTYHYCSVDGCDAKEKHSGEVTGKTGSWTETCSCGATRTAKIRLELEFATWSK